MDKKAPIKQYKGTAIPAGVYRVWNKTPDRSFVGSSVNLPAILNRHRGDLATGGHRNPELQKDWVALGADAFAFEGLDELEPGADADYDAAKEVKELEELWLERLQPYGGRGYNSRPPK